MGGASLPPGFRFHPTDEELVGYYLKRKVDGLQIELEVIPVIDLYKFDPWELPGTENIRTAQELIEPPKLAIGKQPDAFALCRVVKKNESTQKTNDSQGECKSMRLGSSSSYGVLNEPLSISSEISLQASYRNSDSRYSSPLTSPFPNEVTPVSEFEPTSTETNHSSLWVSPDYILDSSKDYPLVNNAISEFIPQYEYSNFTGETGHSDDLNQFGYANYMGNEAMSYEGYDQTSSLFYENLF
ncbi:hypothetical protein ACFE04_031754 [Oxalis oulophora]